MWRLCTFFFKLNLLKLNINRNELDRVRPLDLPSKSVSILQHSLDGAKKRI